MGKIKQIWSCSECGHNQTKWAGCCPTCKEWNTFIEDVEVSAQMSRFELSGEKVSKPMRICDVKDGQVHRIQTGFAEFDRLLGGGIVRGSLSLIGGDPGIGKSTLMLQLAHHLTSQGLTVLYICGEESAEQTSLRARRLNISSSQLYLLAENLFSSLKLHIDQLKPDALIVDSIQVMYKREIQSAPGSVAQIREITTEFMHLSKRMGISIFLIGHVTKSGEIAGPRVLEHLVDTVLEFEGDCQHGYRMLRAIKNRFGPTDDLSIFQMEASGLKEVKNPSSIFLEEKPQQTAGSVIIPTMEGSRAILVEVQALVAPSAFPTSTRKSTGLNPNRLTLLLAVIEKKMGYHMHSKDVFVSVAGGLKITEPAIDLGVALAICSSFSNRMLEADTVVLGEVGLSGEVRSVPRIERRIKESINMGFTKVLIPERHQGELKKFEKKIKIIPVKFIGNAIQILSSEK